MLDTSQMNNKAVIEHHSPMSWGLAGLGFLAGLVISWGILSGDQLGRVNFLYLLLLFVIWPMVTLLLTLASLMMGGKSSLTRSLTRLPLWPERWLKPLKTMSRHGLAQPWLFCQSQILALSFSLGNLLAFMLLLLGSDLNFVWRSTLLDAEQLLPVLDIIAAPWFFWSSAQPSLELLQLTRDSRLMENHENASLYGQWWQFLLAAQCCYAILPRCGLWLLGRAMLIRQQLRLQRIHNRAPDPLVNQPPQEPELAQVVELNDDQSASSGSGVLAGAALINWSGLPLSLLATLEPQLGSPAETLVAGPLASPAQEQQALNWQGPKVLIVAAWEPPLGELKDFLEGGRGYLLPLDWNNDQWQAIKSVHLDEWRRFCFTLENWQLLQLKEPV